MVELLCIKEPRLPPSLKSSVKVGVTYIPVGEKSHVELMEIFPLIRLMGYSLSPGTYYNMVGQNPTAWNHEHLFVEVETDEDFIEQSQTLEYDRTTVS